jgi:hypothetical protein
MMNNAIDQTGDLNGQQLYRLSRLYPLPPFVKKASGDDIYGEGDMQNHQYADPARRLFPCHTGPATYISTLFFLDKKASLDADTARFIESRLDDFAFYHGIRTSVDELKTKLASNTVRDNVDDLDDSDFALVLVGNESPSGAIERHYPLRNGLEIKQAAEWLRRYEADLPYRYRQKIATNILAKAAQVGANLSDLDDYLQKQSGVGVCSAVDAVQFLFNRAKLLKRAGKLDYAIKVAEVAKAVAGQPASVHDQDRLVKLAGLVDDLDRETGLNRLIEDLPRPEDVFFSITEKAASELRKEYMSTTSGNFYKLQDMDRLKLADVRDTMGDDFAEAVSAGGLMLAPEKMADVVPTLPRGDAELFDRLLQSVGIHPVAKEAAHERGGFDDADLRVLATAHRGLN